MDDNGDAGDSDSFDFSDTSDTPVSKHSVGFWVGISFLIATIIAGAAVGIVFATRHKSNYKSPDPTVDDPTDTVPTTIVKHYKWLNQCSEEGKVVQTCVNEKNVKVDSSNCTGIVKPTYEDTCAKPGWKCGTVDNPTICKETLSQSDCKNYFGQEITIKPICLIREGTVYKTSNACDEKTKPSAKFYCAPRSYTYTLDNNWIMPDTFETVPTVITGGDSDVSAFRSHYFQYWWSILHHTLDNKNVIVFDAVVAMLNFPVVNYKSDDNKVSIGITGALLAGGLKLQPSSSTIDYNINVTNPIPISTVLWLDDNPNDNDPFKIAHHPTLDGVPLMLIETGGSPDNRGNGSVGIAKEGSTEFITIRQLISVLTGVTVDQYEGQKVKHIQFTVQNIPAKYMTLLPE